MLKSFVVSLFLLPILSAQADELTALQSNTIAAQIEANPFIANLVQQGLVKCVYSGDSEQESAQFVGCMNSFVFTQVGRWGICAKRFPTLDARSLEPCIRDQERAQKLAIASLAQVDPDKFNRCAGLSLYEPEHEVISAFYLDLGKEIIQTDFKTNAANSFVLSLGPFDSEVMLTCVAN